MTFYNIANIDIISGVSPDNASGSSGKSISEHNADSGHPDSPDDDGLGPLPPHWEKAYTDKGEPYFIDHNTGKRRSSDSTERSRWFIKASWFPSSARQKAK